MMAPRKAYGEVETLLPHVVSSSGSRPPRDTDGTALRTSFSNLPPLSCVGGLVP